MNKQSSGQGKEPLNKSLGKLAQGLHNVHVMKLLSRRRGFQPINKKSVAQMENKKMVSRKGLKQMQHKASDMLLHPLFLTVLKFWRKDVR